MKFKRHCCVCLTTHTSTSAKIKYSLRNHKNKIKIFRKPKRPNPGYFVSGFFLLFLEEAEEQHYHQHLLNLNEPLLSLSILSPATLGKGMRRIVWRVLNNYFPEMGVFLYCRSPLLEGNTLRLVLVGFFWTVYLSGLMLKESFQEAFILEAMKFDLFLRYFLDNLPYDLERSL